MFDYTSMHNIMIKREHACGISIMHRCKATSINILFLGLAFSHDRVGPLMISPETKI